MRRAGVQSVLLLLVGGSLVKITVLGTYARYVKVGQRGYLIAAGAVLVIVAAANLIHAVRAGSRHDHDDGHGHTHSGLNPAWLLLAPVLALLLVAPPALGSYAASRGGTALAAAAGSDYPPLPGGDPVRLSVLDYAGRALDKGRSLGIHRVTLSGFILAGKGDRRYLTRMVITCCAADARPIEVGLAGTVPADLSPDAWLEVTGVYTASTDTDPFTGNPIPYISVQTAHPIPAPKQPYES